MTITLQKKHNIQIPRWCTMKLLRHMDSFGVMQRLRRTLHRRTYCALGPSYLWHADGHDKLKRFGFAIHACMDGYSRRVVWARCASSNNNPAIIASYYLATVKELGGCPQTLRTDCGTENGIMSSIQCSLRSTRHAHIYGSYQNNQRIESWWWYLRKSRLQWWIDMFSDMEHAGAINIDHEGHIDCLRFCFMGVLQRDLAEARALWNGHRVRKSNGATCPGGVPDELFFSPGRSTRQCLIPVSVNDCDQFTHQCSLPTTCQDKEFEKFLSNVCSSRGITFPPSWQEALRLYFHLHDLLF